MAPPALDDDLGFAKRVEDFAVEQLVAQASIEALDVAILPWTAPLDVSGRAFTSPHTPFAPSAAVRILRLENLALSGSRRSLRVAAFAAPIIASSAGGFGVAALGATLGSLS
jgi:hypothetical protein